MAGEEGDSELRDLVAQTLETQGVLGKIRAQLRASVFLALEQDKKDNPNRLVNDRFNSFMQTEDGHLTAGLVREFLQFFELDFTCSVFDPETNVLKHFNGREKLAADTGLSSSTDSPLLLQLLKRARSTPSLVATGTSHATPTSSVATVTSHTTPASSVATGTSHTTPASSVATVTSHATPASSSSIVVPTLPIVSLPSIISTAGSSVIPPSSLSQATPLTTISQARHTTVSDSSKLTSTSITPVTLTTVLSSPAGSISSTLPVSSNSGGTRVTNGSRVPSKSTLVDQGLSANNNASSNKNTSSVLAGLLSQGNKTGVEERHSDNDSDEETIPSQKWDTTDHSLSPNSTSAADEFDYTEHIK